MKADEAPLGRERKTSTSRCNLLGWFRLAELKGLHDSHAYAGERQLARVASLTGMAERFGPFSRRINLKAQLSRSRPIF
jgi:hypothetical protein